MYGIYPWSIETYWFRVHKSVLLQTSPARHEPMAAQRENLQGEELSRRDKKVQGVEDGQRTADGIVRVLVRLWKPIHDQWKFSELKPKKCRVRIVQFRRDC
jgi:hypothetical protein